MTADSGHGPSDWLNRRPSHDEVSPDARQASDQLDANDSKEYDPAPRQRMLDHDSGGIADDPPHGDKNDCASERSDEWMRNPEPGGEGLDNQPIAPPNDAEPKPLDIHPKPDRAEPEPLEIHHRLVRAEPEQPDKAERVFPDWSEGDERLLAWIFGPQRESLPNTRLDSSEREDIASWFEDLWQRLTAMQEVTDEHLEALNTTLNEIRDASERIGSAR